MVTTSTMSPTMTKTCSAKKRESVAAPMIGPPSTAWTSGSPISGVRPAIAMPMPTPQYASWSQRSTCPVKAMPSVSKKSRQPDIHVSSRGYLYAPNRKTCARWTDMIATMKFEPQ